MKWFMVVLAVIAALIVGIYVLDLADIIDVKAITMTALDKWSVTHPYIETYRLGLSEDILLQEKKMSFWLLKQNSWRYKVDSWSVKRTWIEENRN